MKPFMSEKGNLQENDWLMGAGIRGARRTHDFTQNIWKFESSGWIKQWMSSLHEISSYSEDIITALWTNEMRLFLLQNQYLKVYMSSEARRKFGIFRAGNKVSFAIPLYFCHLVTQFCRQFRIWALFLMRQK